MKNFLRIKKGLLKLIKSKSIELIEPTILNIFVDDQLAFKNHIIGELQ